MPDDVEPSFDLEAMRVAATRSVGEWLDGLPGGAVRLTDPNLAGYAPRAFVAGWRMTVGFSDRARRVDLLLPSDFPWRAPRVALVDRPPFLTWPHVEQDGVLCLGPDGQEIDPFDPVSVAQRLLGEASRLVENLISGACVPDFQAEFVSYWDHAATYKGTSIVSLLSPEPPSRPVRLWRGQTTYLLGEDEASIRAWLVNRYGSVHSKFTTDAAPFFWIGGPPFPNGYPTSAADLRALISDSRDLAMLDEIVAEMPDRITAILGIGTANGPALAAVMLAAPESAPHGAHNTLIKGFRPGRVPTPVLTARYYGGARVTRATVTRADPLWIHGRGEDVAAQGLRGKTVAIIGCGSVGTPVAIALAQAGVGKIVLVDPDVMKWPNVGRHPLGASAVGKMKAKALAEKLRIDFPHMTVDHHTTDLETVLRTQPELLRDSTLVIAATGSWAAESMLDTWHAAIGRCPPILYVWTEAHACAGHAVLICEVGSFRAGFDSTGLPWLQVTAWPAGDTQLREPACGAVYQPYGPVELAFVHALAAELALDALLANRTKTTHRIWAAPRERLVRLGGEWSADWRAIAGDSAGGQIHERCWPEAATTPIAEAAAA
ncbi:ThiF family adenylyltransferase [Mesorhizobium sp.]|uniref:ThiF family adenylyltransferase n=1 Tax=Mesorhizobium sp. TaxID=1871066 RepID=UPI000FEA3A1D|nr:ThiF family adenylyltransferase [Mesorhizobium sp.]RWJ00051.1 MAG: ubiquitin-activating enzyme [Mesorhizobium sp.]